MKSRDITFFEFFIMLDVNKSGSVSKIEFKTGGKIAIPHTRAPFASCLNTSTIQWPSLYPREISQFTNSKT